ncbi:hypothetical protein [Sinorhizobium fredii]|uniref:hypothetical protein n=1 Tax=Rhizobium fredii TaxID=380 RepID=UPI0012FD1891|nr:hypothetical protein [Sinorhizobium fredii]
MTILLFDMDGVLTEARQPMTVEMAQLVIAAASRHSSYIVTGSDCEKVREQVPPDVLGWLAGVFTCGGNEFWFAGDCVFGARHDFPSEMVEAIEALLKASPYPVRTGAHVERRAGMLNVSVVGRNADPLQRLAYAGFDRTALEREALAATIMTRFPGYEAVLGGDISIDIVPKGRTKAQVAGLLPSKGPVYFFADRLDPGGNDWPLAKALRAASPANRNFRVNSPKDTKVFLEALLHGVMA